MLLLHTGWVENLFLQKNIIDLSTSSWITNLQSENFIYTTFLKTGCKSLNSNSKKAHYNSQVLPMQ